jgi:hypothetical protein
MSRVLDRETLAVYRAALAFLDWLESMLPELPKSLSVVDPLDRANTSIPLPIAEGNGTFTGADRGRCRSTTRSLSERTR